MGNFESDSIGKENDQDIDGGLRSEEARSTSEGIMKMPCGLRTEDGTKGRRCERRAGCDQDAGQTASNARNQGGHGSGEPGTELNQKEDELV